MVMKGKESESKRMVQWVILFIIVALVVGCGHRSSRGIHHHSKKSSSPSVLVNGSENAKADSSNSHKGKSSEQEGYFPVQEGSFSDLLQDEPLVFEESQTGNSLGQASGDDYWVNRTRAEQLTERAGLQDVHFEFDSFQLTEQAKEVLSSNAEWIKAHPEAVVTIEGHCDDRGTQAYNYVLGEKRAIRTKAFLASLGVASRQLQTMTYGKDNPACLDATETCYRKNRRAHLVLGVGGASTTAMHIR